LYICTYTCIRLPLASGDRFCTCANRYGTCANKYGTWANKYGTCANKYGTCANRHCTCANKYGTCAHAFDCTLVWRNANTSWANATSPSKGSASPKFARTCTGRLLVTLEDSARAAVGLVVSRTGTWAGSVVLAVGAGGAAAGEKAVSRAILTLFSSSTLFRSSMSALCGASSGPCATVATSLVVFGSCCPDDWCSASLSSVLCSTAVISPSPLASVTTPASECSSPAVVDWSAWCCQTRAHQHHTRTPETTERSSRAGLQAMPVGACECVCKHVNGCAH